MKISKTPLILIATLLMGGQQLLVAEDEASTPEAEEESGGGLFDLFGRRIDPDAAAVEGDMPAGPLKIVVDRSAPRFGSKRRGSSSRSRSSRSSGSSKRIQWTQKRPNFVNSGGSGASGATHLVKNGSRVYLKSY
ncbi:MAG: hypothetical protein ACI8UO_006134 [Verrucomicrobiales bacterium]